MCDHPCSRQDPLGHCCICVSLLTTTVDQLCNQCNARAYSDELHDPQWCLLGVIAFEERKNAWEWVKRLPKKDCLHHFWQVYSHESEVQFKLRCLACEYELDLGQIDLPYFE